MAKKLSFEVTPRIRDRYAGFSDARIRRLRLMHKATGQVVNVKGLSLAEAVTHLEWDPDHTYWVDLGALSVRWLKDHKPILSFYFASEPVPPVPGEEG